MVCVNILMNKRNIANCVFKDSSFNFLCVIYFLEEMFKDYNKNLIDEKREEVLATRMLVNGYQNYCGFSKHINFPDATKTYLLEKYPREIFCRLNKMTKFYVNVEPRDVEKALKDNKYVVIIDMDEKTISHNLYREFSITVASDMNKLNARINDFHICDIDTIKKFMINNMKKYFLDEKGDKAYYIDNTTFF